MKQPLFAVAYFAALAVTLIFASCSKDGKVAKESVALVVNGDTVTSAQVGEAAEFLRLSQAALSPGKIFEGGTGDDLRRAAARQLAANLLLTAEARSRGWRADSAAVSLIAVRFMAQFPSREAFLAYLAETGESEESMRKGLEEELLIDSLLSTALESAAAPVSESDCFERYEGNKERYVEPGRARASHIVFLLSPSATDSQVQAALERANAALAKARTGTDFDALVREYSSSPGDGDMGWFKRGDLIPDIERKLFLMTVGEVSDPVPSSMGIHILKKTGEETPRQLSYSEAAESIKKALEIERKAAAANAYVDSLLLAAEIVYVDSSLVFERKPTEVEGKEP